MSPEILSKANNLAAVLRQNDIKTEVYTLDTPFKKKLDFANKLGIPFVAILGDDEIAAESVTIKDMVSSEQQTVKLPGLLDYLISRLF